MPRKPVKTSQPRKATRRRRRGHRRDQTRRRCRRTSRRSTTVSTIRRSSTGRGCAWPNGARVARLGDPQYRAFSVRPAVDAARQSAGQSRRAQLFLARLRRARRHLADDGGDASATASKARSRSIPTSARHYPRIIEEGNKLGWEWMGHGNNNSTLINAPVGGRGARADQRRRRHDHARASARRRAAGSARRLSETVRTLDILAENGIEYVGNWVNDEQPYPMRVKKGLDDLACRIPWRSTTSRRCSICIRARRRFGR